MPRDCRPRRFFFFEHARCVIATAPCTTFQGKNAKKKWRQRRRAKMCRESAAAATASAHSTEDPHTGDGAEQSLPRTGAAAAAGAAPPADEMDGGQEEQSPPPSRVDVDLTGDDSDAESYRVSSDENTEEEPEEEGGASDTEEERDPDPKGEWRSFCFHVCRVNHERWTLGSVPFIFLSLYHAWSTLSQGSITYCVWTGGAS